MFYCILMSFFQDCVWQIQNQFPCSFEYSDRFLILLSDESYASNYGTFLGDSEAERKSLRVQK